MQNSSRTFLLWIALTSVVLSGCDDTTTAPELQAATLPTPLEILTAAQAAHGGAAALRAVTALRVRSDLCRGAQRWPCDVTIAPGNCFLQRIDTGSVVITHGSDGKETWAALDFMTVELSDAERNTLREQALLLRPDLLVELADPTKFEIAACEGPPGALHVQGRAKHGAGGPWRFSFDPDTKLLTGVVLQSAATATELRLEDYRVTGSVRTAWRARWMHAGHESATNHVRALDLNPEIEANQFSPPQRSETELSRVMQGVVAEAPELRVPTSRWADGAARLTEHLKTAGLERAGPLSGDIVDGKLVAMSVAITELPSEVCGPVLEDAVRPVLTPRSSHLRQFVPEGNVEEIAARPHNLHTAAAARGLKPAGPLHLVRWGETHWILQLLLEN